MARGRGLGARPGRPTGLAGRSRDRARSTSWSAAQRADGYLDTFYQVARPGLEFTDLEWGHELYLAGHLGQAAIAWQRGLGDDRLLRVVERYVDRIWEELGPGRRELVDGHPGAEMALVGIDRMTDRSRYLELRALLVERRGHGLLARVRFGNRYWRSGRWACHGRRPRP